MTKEEIRMMYRDAADKKKQIGILADLTLMTKDEIRDIVADPDKQTPSPCPARQTEAKKQSGMDIRQARIGKNGSFTIPKVMRVAAGIFSGSVVDVALSGGGVAVRPHSELCRICGSPEDVTVLRGVGVCRPCAGKILERGE